MDSRRGGGLAGAGHRHRHVADVADRRVSGARAAGNRGRGRGAAGGGAVRAGDCRIAAAGGCAERGARPADAVLKDNLAAIDRAVGESRAALASEPASALAQDSLLDALDTKVALLQDTVALTSEDINQ